jgi:hypothetical protein
MTGPSSESEFQYRQILSIGQCGLEYPDEIVRHAAKHLDIITSPPAETPPLTPYTSRRAEYPFPSVRPSTNHLQTPKRSFTSPSQIRAKPGRSFRHMQQSSISSILSTSSFRVGGLSIKSTPSIGSLVEYSAEITSSPIKRGATGAADVLRRVQAQSISDLRSVESKADGGEAWWPTLSTWSYTKARDTISPIISTPGTPSDQSTVTAGSSTSMADAQSAPAVMATPETQLQIPTIRTVASTPTFGSLRLSSNLAPTLPSSTGALTPRPFDHLHTDINLTIDPALAAAELASTLTKRIKCGVCRTEGINFPECRKCGLTFCSRECRVGGDKAGNGKKHVCGAWESRKGLCVPERIDGRRGSKSAASRPVMAC